MRSSLTLQRSLFDYQKRQIARQVQGASRAFRAYEARYHRATRDYVAPLAMEDVHRRVAEADVVHVGDYHTLRLAQQAYLELVEQALTCGRRVVLALEFVEGRHQRTLDAYLSGALTARGFLERIGHPYHGPFDIWPGFEPILKLARRRRLEVVAIDRRAQGPRALALRDDYAARRIARAAAAPDRPLVLSLIGQFHVAPGHVPQAVARALGRTSRRQLIVYQNAEGAWWQLAKAGLAQSVRAVDMGADALCLYSASPVVCQRSFLDYVEAESGDRPLAESGLSRTFRVLVRDIARVTGVKLGPGFGDLAVLTAADLDPLERLSSRADFTARELAHLERHVLSRDSAWIPRARAAWLSSLSLNHAAEEAAHCVRSASVGAAMDRPRPLADAFWARCMEEALGFFGSRLVNPARRCTTFDGWVEHFTGGSGEQQRVAAYVVALSAALSRPGPIPASMLPLTPLTRFHAVSHALGYLLGDALARAWASGGVTTREVRALFADPLDDAFATFSAWRSRLQPSARRSAA